MGLSLKRVFSNPVKSVSDIGTLGFTAAFRTLPKKLGGGQSGFFSKTSEVIGSTAIGVGIGATTGGFPGAIVGGAAGFGRGISGVVNSESGKNIAGGAAKWSAITGSFAGAVRGTGAAGFVRNQIVTGAAKVPALPKVPLPSAASLSTAVISAATLLNSLRPGTSNVSVTPPDNPNAATGVTQPGSINIGNPSGVPSAAPSPSMPSSILALPAEAAPFPYWVLVFAAAIGYAIWHKKRRAH